jgi:hypothetical protein
MYKYIILTLLLTITTSAFAAWSEQSRTVTDVATTVDDVIDRVREIIDDPYTNTGSVRYSTTTILNLVDKAHKVFCIQTEALTTSATMSFTLGTTDYALPTNCIYVERVAISVTGGLDSGTENFKYLKQKTVWGLDIENTSWDLSSSTPTAFYIRNRYMGFYPAPSFSGAEVYMQYVKIPTTLDETTDNIFDGYTQLEPYGELLALYVAAKLALQDGNTTLYSSLIAEWNSGLVLAKGYLRYNPLYNPNNAGDSK